MSVGVSPAQVAWAASQFVDSATAMCRLLDRGPCQARSTTVRRSLFGPVDHEEALRFAKEELAKLQQQQSLKWNFDFEREVPLPGRFHWTPVSDDTASDLRVSNTSTNASNSSKNISSASTNVHARTNAPTSSLTIVRRQQKITEFLRKRKASTGIAKSTAIAKTKSSSSPSISPILLKIPPAQL